MAERFNCSLYFVEAPRDVCLAFSILAQTASAYFLCWLIYLLPHTYFTMGFLTIFKSDDRVAIWAALSTSMLAFLQGLDGQIHALVVIRPVRQGDATLHIVWGKLGMLGIVLIVDALVVHEIGRGFRERPPG